MSGSTDSPTQDSLKELRQLVDKLSSTVDQQHQILLTARPDIARQMGAQASDEMARTLVYARRHLEDLERQVKAQEKEREQLKALQEVGAVINSTLDLDQVLRLMMDTLLELTNAERAVLLLREDRDTQLTVKVVSGIDEETIENADSFEISRTIVQNVSETGEPVVTMNAMSDPRFSAQESIISYNLRSILCVPLKMKDQIIGVIYADNKVASGIFRDADRDLLAAFANQAAVAIDNARLFQQILDNLKEITEMKDLMDNVFESIASGVITIDAASQIELYNRAAERILGIPSSSAKHQKYSELLEALELPIEPFIQEVWQNGGTQNTEIDLVVNKRPGITTLNMTVSPLRDVLQETLGVAMVLNDVSETKRLESVRRYLPPELVDSVRDIDAAQRPQHRTMTVVFADVRGFSTFSEKIDPEKLIQVINGYFTEAVKAITHYQGLTDKFLGDAVMALYNTPLNPQDNHAERAVRTAWMIKQSMAAYHEHLPLERRLHFGFGIHTGDAVVGNVGSALRKDYSAIGDAVNLAKRVQENAKAGQILMSEAVYVQVKGFVEVVPMEPMQVKGRQAFEQFYELVNITG
ncbi:MAG: GAF domain-containing protein [Ardenticatenaceae bacterium]|nr:GAF domain-containing protein [Ardenticatenaceae bacterium]